MSASVPRNAVVTGGTRGIGLGIAHALAREGWDLTLCGTRAEADVAVTLKDLRSDGGTIDYVRADISDPADRARLVDQVRRQHGAPNLLVNNAGRAPGVRADILEATEASFEQLVRTNLQGPYFLTQAIARDQVARRQASPGFHASIVFITSISAKFASLNRGEYCISKAGLAMAVKLFAARLAEHGIAVYEVRPGIIATDMTSGVRDTYDRRITEGVVPERRWGQPEDIGRIVAALARGDLPYATGSVIAADGGLSLPRF